MASWYDPSGWDWEVGGGIIGGAAGGVGGFFAGGPAGAIAGASTGYGVGSSIGGGIQGDDEDPLEADQKKLLEALWRQSQQGDPLAREQLRQATSRNMSMEQAFAASAAPQNQAMAARLASQNAARQRQGMAGQGALADIQGRLGALGSIGNVLHGARTQDLRQQQIAAAQPSAFDYAMSGIQTAAQLETSGIFD